MSALDQALALLRGYCACRGDDEFLNRAVAELETLKQSEREGWRHADELEQERKRLREAVDLSLIALEMECTSPPIDETALAMKACRAAIAGMESKT